MAKIRLSIIVPSYNKGNYILQLISGLLRNQLEPSDEILVIDNISTDPLTLESYKKIESIDPRIKVLHCKKKGAAAARNFGIKVAKGDYILFLDSDDIISPNYIESAFKSLLLSNNKVSYTYPSVIVTFSKNKIIGYRRTSAFSFEQLKRYNYIPVSSLFKSQVLKEINGFDEELNSLEDWDLYLRLGKKGYIGIMNSNPEEMFLLYRINLSGSVNAAISKPYARIKNRTKILKRNNFYSFSTQLWNMLSIAYGLASPLVNTLEKKRFNQAPINIQKGVLECLRHSLLIF